MKSPVTRPGITRCAIYTRKSSEEGLQQDFNSLDAQRESGESYISSMKGEGWVCLPDRYDDGGFSGGNTERPALRRLMADVEAGKVDCVVVYKVDRLSRSLSDFARLMETFEKQKVSFVSVTQRFDTSQSMGRLTLNVLLSFAQFERELASERTRDKIAAARRKGKWAGGHPILGYDVDPRGFRLEVNEIEAPQVRAIFDMYLEHQSLLETVKVIDQRGWRNKQWVTRKGKMRAGKPFDKNSLLRLLTNIAYIGRVRHKEENYPGEHAAIVDPGVFQQVQQLLTRNGRTGGVLVRNKYGALLKGLLHCAPCRCAMGHTYSSKKGSGTKYRYYVCLGAQKRGWHTCPSKAVPAGEIERMVIDQIRAIGQDPGLIAATLRHARREVQDSLREIEAKRAAAERELQRYNRDVRVLAADVGAGGSAALARLSDLNDRIRIAEQSLAALHAEAEALNRRAIDEDEVVRALSQFDPVWEALAPREQARIVRLLIERIVYDGAAGTVSITFHPEGFTALATGSKEAAA